MADRYWAFISYSHRDEAWSRWLHRSLETFRLPARIAGRETRSGRIPARLFPVFRDRDELPGSSELGRNLESALASSEYLVVICSPHAASSRWVNEEVLRFKSMGRPDRILALIVDGEPNASDKPELGLAECFPATLAHAVDAEGHLTRERVEPIAADVRPGKDGRHAAILKIVAGIVGVGYDELRQRDRQRTLRRNVATGAVTLAAAGLLLGGAYWAADRARLEALEERGREALMAGESGRAAAYLAEAYRGGRDTDSLRVMLGIAMPAVEKALATVQAHSGAIRDVAISSDGSIVASAGDDGSVRTWAGRDGRPLRILQDGGPTYSELRFGPADATLVGLGAKGVRTWDLRSGTVADDFEIPPPPARKRLGSNGRFLYLQRQGEVQVWHLAERRALGSVAIRERFSATENRSGTLLIVMDDERSGAMEEPRRVRAFALPSLAPRFEFTVRGVPWAWDFDARDTRFALVTRGGDLGIWNLADGRRLLESRYPSYLRDVRFSPDGSELLVASYDGTIKSWDASTGWLRQSLEGHRGAVLKAEYLPGAERVLSRGSDGTLRLWDRRLGDALITVEAHKDQSLRGLVAAGGRSLVSSNARRGELSFWSLERTQPARMLAAHRERVHSVEFGARGDRLLTASDEEARLWTFPELRLLATFERSYATFVGDGHVAVTSNREARVALVEASDGRIRSEHRQAGKPLLFFLHARDRSEAIVFADDGSAVRVRPDDAPVPLDLPALGRERSVHLSDWGLDKSGVAFTAEGAAGVVSLASGAVEMRVPRKGDVLGAKFSPEGDALLVIDGHQLKTVEIRGGTQRATRPLAGDPFFFERACDGRMLVLAGWDKSIALFDASGKREVATLPGHTGVVIGADCDAAARYFFSGSIDGTTRLWRLDDGKPLASFGTGRRPHFGVSLSRDGTTLATTGDDGAVRFWPIERESRPPAVVAASVACRVPWRVKGLDLEPAEPKAQNCRP